MQPAMTLPFDGDADTCVASPDAPHGADLALTLQALIARYGDGLLDAAPRLKGLLHDECPQARREISILMQALEQRVPHDLLRVQSGEPLGSIAPRLVRRLESERAMSGEASAWAVREWARGLGLDDAAVPVHAPSAPIDAAVANDASPRTGPSTDRLASVSGRGRSIGLAAIAALVLVGGFFGLRDPQLAIVGVDAPEVLAADGRATPVFVDIEARDAHIKAIEVRVVRADPPWKNDAWSVAVDAQGGRLPAGSLSQVAPRLGQATLEFVAVAGNGLRSAPVSKSIVVAPPAVLTSVTLARPARVGQEIAFSLAYQRGAFDIVRIEHRLVEGPDELRAAAPTLVQTTLPHVSGSVVVRADAVRSPMRGVWEFVLVDAKGLRSEPRRLGAEVTHAPPAVRGPGAGVVVAVEEAWSVASIPGLGAVIGGVLGGVLGSKVGAGQGKTAATVAGAAGGAAAGHVVQGNLGSTRSWTVTVRLADGATVRGTSSVPLRVGERVEVAGGTVSRAR